MVTMHESFGYFAEAYGLEIVGSIQRIPGLDPDLATRQRLVELCKKENVSVIAVEPQYSQAQAESLQTTLKKAGVDVAIVVLDPLETCDVERGKTNPDPGFYLKKLRENIDTLAKALK
jgi:ABC-type Zn uptake system ZnuABC Zn-binding protein ZnuA